MIRLEPVAVEHLPLLRSLVADPAVQRFTRIPVPPPPDFPEQWLDAYLVGRTDGTRAGFAIVDDETRAQLGMAVAPTIEPEAATAELGAERLELRISVDNVASKRVAERCGYVRDGVLRSLYVKEGLREDTEVWSRLPGDPPAGS